MESKIYKVAKKMAELKEKSEAFAENAKAEWTKGEAAAEQAKK